MQSSNHTRELDTPDNRQSISSKSFDLYGDCVGMGKPMGKPVGNGYIQSDMQFVQFAQEQIRAYPRDEGSKESVLPDGINMSVFARFFVNDMVGENTDHTITASELHIDYGQKLAEFVEEATLECYTGLFDHLMEEEDPELPEEERE